MDQSYRRKPSTKLALESLESRLNLSTLHGFVAPHPTATPPLRIVGTPVAKQTPIALLGGAASTAPAIIKLGGAATTISSNANTSIPVNSYSDISNSSIETWNGQQDIGYVAPWGAYVEYTVNAAAGGYSLNMDLGSLSGADLQVTVNGTKQGTIDAPGTGAWQTYTHAGSTIQLSAGLNVIRLSSMYGTQYNIANISMASTGSINITNVADNTTVPITAYSSIYGSRLENNTAGPDIGYVSASGAFVDYNVNIATAGTYNLTVGASAVTPGSTFDVLDNGFKVATYTVGNTGGWQSYQNYTQSINLTAGVHTLRFNATNGSQYNLLSLQFARQIPTTTVTPPPAPVPVPSGSDAVNVVQRNMTSFIELDVTGTADSANITISQSGNTYTITANGASETVTGTFGDLVVTAPTGNATITVDSSVKTNTRIYTSGVGNDIVKNLTTGQATIVSFGGGIDTITGNGINTAYWVDPTDIVNASAAEKANGDVHSISGFYQPFTTTPGAYGYVTTARDGTNLVDPTGTGTTMRLSNSSFWGTGPVITDVNQGSVNDCYYVTALQSLANFQPAKLYQLAVDLGDGTYAVQFTRNGKTSYVRVDGDLATTSWGGLNYAHTGNSGNQWVAIMEKAYAFFRNGTTSYSSLDFGFMSTVYSDLGIKNNTLIMPSDQNSFYNTTVANLSVKKPVDILTNSAINGGAPLVASHTYSVVAINKDSSGTVWVTLRNPWGYDGFNVDSNPWDALVTINYATLLANCTFACTVA